MRYTNDQEDIWDTRRTMASYPELRLCRRLLRVPGYGSLWHSGRGWIALPSPVTGLRFQRAGSPSEVPSSISGMMRFLEARSRSQVPYWSSLSSNEGEKAERLRCLAIEKAPNVLLMGVEEVHRDSLLNLFKCLILGSEIDLIKEVLVGMEINWSNEVHPQPGLDFFMHCLRTTAREIDLSKDVHVLARIEHALAKFHNELSVMLFIMPSFASLMYTRQIIDITGLLRELDQLVLQHVKSPIDALNFMPEACICEMSHDQWVSEWILSNLSEGVAYHSLFSEWILSSFSAGVAIHFMNEAIVFGQTMCENRQVYLEQVSSKQFADKVSILFMDYDAVATLKAEGDRGRIEFLERAELKPPPVLRMIDCKATRDEGRVVLMDWKDCVQALGYSAISHTYGQDVYHAFDCTCASICRAAQKPRCSFDTCPHDPAAQNAANTTQTRVVKDILNMCVTLCGAGVRYAWHDGVCIAQHDEDEVRETIQHIGWVYSNGRETIIFLHYVGKPMAPIRVNIASDQMLCRWHTRVWTFQEAVLSKRRRYCIRMGKKAVRKWDQSPVEIIKNVRLWYEDGSSSVEVVEEERLYEILTLLSLKLAHIPEAALENESPFIVYMLWRWSYCILQLALFVKFTCVRFPTIDDALRECTSRESKHRGDRINSILTLAGVTGFAAPKDRNMEASTLLFFEKQGQKGLARALFGINRNMHHTLDLYPAHEPRRHKWLPVLGETLDYNYIDGLEKGMRLRVLGNGRLEVRPGDEADQLLCERVRIVVRSPQAGAPLNFPRYVDGGEEAVAGVLRSLSTRARGSITMFDVNLEFPQCVLLLPQAPSYPVGAIYTSLLDTTESGIDCVVNPIENDNPERRLLKENESFDAYLVTTSRSNSEWILLLHGSDILNGEVSKIGVLDSFYPAVFKDFMLTSNIRPEKVIII